MEPGRFAFAISAGLANSIGNATRKPKEVLCRPRRRAGRSSWQSSRHCKRSRIERFRTPDQLRRGTIKPRQIWYLLNAQTAERGWPCVLLWQRQIKQNGSPGKLKVAKFFRKEIAEFASAEDQALIGLLVGNERDIGYRHGDAPYHDYLRLHEFALAPAMFEIVLPRLCTVRQVRLSARRQFGRFWFGARRPGSSARLGRRSGLEAGFDDRQSPRSSRRWRKPT